MDFSRCCLSRRDPLYSLGRGDSIMDPFVFLSVVRVPIVRAADLDMFISLPAV